MAQINENWVIFKELPWIQNGRFEKRQFGITKWSVSDHGNVKREYYNQEGQLVKAHEVHQHWKGRTKKYLAIPTGEYVHRLVAQHFIPNPQGHKLVLFQNGDLTNLKVSNLMWHSGKGIRTGIPLGKRPKKIVNI